MSRLDRDGWIALGREAVTDPAPDAMTLEALCARAGRTRGSFYHHFESVPAFIVAIAGDWERRATLDIINKADQSGDTIASMQTLDSLTRMLDPKVDQGMRRIALTHAGVAEIVARVDRTRIAYLEKLHIALAPDAGDHARGLARIEYAAFLGLQQLDDSVLEIERDVLYKQFIGMIAAR